MTNLNQDLRNAIVSAAIKHRFADECEQLLQQARFIANDAYLSHYNPEILKKMTALPQGWLEEKEEFKVQFGFAVHHLHFTGFHHSIPSVVSRPWLEEEKLQKEQRRRFLKKDLEARVVHCFDFQHPLTLRVDAHQKSKEDLRAQISAARDETHRALSKFRTVKTLIEAWPEIAPFIPAASSKAYLPAIPVATLNKILDLPVDLPKEAA